MLGDIRSEPDTWQAMNTSGRYSDATPLSTAALGAATELFLDHAWRRFLTVVDHAPDAARPVPAREQPVARRRRSPVPSGRRR
ncbi:hypothetical protein ACIGPN_34950 [Streptomyces afghaniensis]|uniref:hypothetical protein n=1 Tax=Streptomyces afghaniensis TaxID=66865 RepID=UPI0037D1C43F